MARTKEELGGALGCVAYDALVLLAALEVDRDQRECPKYDGLNWGKPQVAIEVILIKCRSLMDFFSPHKVDKGDIVVTDFGGLVVLLPSEMGSFRKSVNKWSAHLTWQRVQRLLTGAPQPTRDEWEQHAPRLLSQARDFICAHMVDDVVFKEERHRNFCEAFLREYSRLVGPGAATP